MNSNSPRSGEDDYNVSSHLDSTSCKTIQSASDATAGLLRETVLYSLEALVSRITPENRHSEVRTGAALGNEFA